MSKGNKLGTIIFSIIVILVLAGVAATVLRLTNGGTDEFKFFYVMDDENKIYATKDSAKLPCNTETKFNVCYTFTNDKGYSVKVVPNITNDTKFVYTVDGEEYEYNSDLDLTPAFKIETYENCFRLKMPTTMQKVLSDVYPGQAVEVPKDLDMQVQGYFRLEVTSYNGNDRISIVLRREPIYAEDVELPENMYIR